MLNGNTQILNKETYNFISNFDFDKAKTKEISSFINNNYVISQNKRDKIKSDVFSNLTDGNVGERVQDNLKLIYENINLNSNNLNN